LPRRRRRSPRSFCKNIFVAAPLSRSVGDAKEPTTRNTVQAELDGITAFVSVLDTAIPARNGEVIALTVDAVGSEWREFGEKFSPHSDTSVRGGARNGCARGAVRGLVLTLRQVAMAAAGGDFDGAAKAFADYRQQVAQAAPHLKLAERWSLFGPDIRESQFAALRQLADLAR
jgi:hypothetical protein